MFNLLPNLPLETRLYIIAGVIVAIIVIGFVVVAIGRPIAKRRSVAFDLAPKAKKTPRTQAFTKKEAPIDLLAEDELTKPVQQESSPSYPTQVAQAQQVPVAPVPIPVVSAPPVVVPAVAPVQPQAVPVPAPTLQPAPAVYPPLGGVPLPPPVTPQQAPGQAVPTAVPVPQPVLAPRPTPVPGVPRQAVTPPPMPPRSTVPLPPSPRPFGGEADESDF